MEIYDERYQGMTNNSLEDVLRECSKIQQQEQQQQQQQQEKKPRPNQETPLKCPRCDSINTKFCYYNNYSLSQPRYFCKGCRRYWTQGGSLRNIPVGGGCRKTKKPSSSSSSSKRSHQDQSLLPLPPPPPPPLGFDTHGSFLIGNQSPNPAHTTTSGLPSVHYGFDAGLVRYSVTSGSSSMDGEEGKVLMGVHWQLGGDEHLGFDSERDGWNGVGSSWHGLINSSLI